MIWIIKSFELAERKEELLLRGALWLLFAVGCGRESEAEDAKDGWKAEQASPVAVRYGFFAATPALDDQ